MNAVYCFSSRTPAFFLFLLIFLSSYSIRISAKAKRGNSNPSSSGYNDRLFESDDILTLTILSDFASMMKDRGEDRSYHKGELYYLNPGNDTVRRKVRLKTRGNFRRDPENCKYPPIMVKFGKENSLDSLFTNQSKLKLVTQCQKENYVLLEYLAYRFYNLLSSYSYRVRLAQITYKDMESKETYFTRYAFFIESETDMTTRINAEIYKPNVVQYYLNRENAITMAMFQYLIGNNDWYVTSKHNNSILKLNETKELITVPYDFDWSMLVNANYTKPEGVSDSFFKNRRVYKGLCLEPEELKNQQELFDSKKDGFVDLVEGLKDLSKKGKQQSIGRIDSFYKLINESSSLQNIFQKEECIKEPIFEGK